MIEAGMDKVEISFPKTPLTEIMHKTAPEALEKAVICTDLKHIFLAISEKYSIADCADIIARALEDMQQLFDEQENNNETNSGT